MIMSCFFHSLFDHICDTDEVGYTIYIRTYMYIYLYVYIDQIYIIFLLCIYRSNIQDIYYVLCDCHSMFRTLISW